MSEPDPDKALKDNAAEFMKLLIRIVKDHHDAVIKSTLVTSALLQAVSERFPEIGESYMRYLEQSEKSSPVADSSRRIADELARLTAALKDD